MKQTSLREEFDIYLTKCKPVAFRERKTQARITLEVKFL